MTISGSVSLSPRSSLRADSAGQGGLITVHGKNITVDLAGGSIRSTRDVQHSRENLEGTGLLIDGCENVVIKNASIQGFRFNIRVVNSKNVRILGCDVSNSRAIRMMRNGDLIDTFLNLRDSNAWREYGAGIWIEKSAGCRVEKSRGSGGTIGAALVDSSKCSVTSSDFSFCGGWGLAMARSKDCVVSWNHFDFDNRAWAGSWGADAAAVGVADDSDRNYFVSNSMTHGGDGFFLSNRNDVGPVDPATGYLTPQGGSDHNVVAYNDGSWSPANAFEGTFSVGNIYFRNRAFDCNYGFWLGFSNDSQLLENGIERSQVDGIAIEQGKGTKIAGNRIVDSGSSAIHLWAGNQKERTPFPSTNIDIYNNILQGGGWAYILNGSTEVASAHNKIAGPRIPDFIFVQNRPADAARRFYETKEFRRIQEIQRARPAGFHFYREVSAPKGLAWLQADDYGPRDYRGHLAAYRMVDTGTIEIWPINSKVKIIVPDWAEIAPGTELNSYVVTAKSAMAQVGSIRDLAIGLSAPGRPGETVRATLQSMVWSRKWYYWAGLTYDDRAAWDKLFTTKPVRSENVHELGGDWSGRAPFPDMRREHFALVATSRIRLEAGKYVFSSLSDDGLRLFVDGKLLIDRWNHHGPTSDHVTADLSSGVHQIRVEYCQEDGAAVLRLDWKRA